MTIRNSMQPHLVKRPCHRCKKLIPALKNGILQSHPVCDECSKDYEDQFKIAFKARFIAGARNTR